MHLDDLLGTLSQLSHSLVLQKAWHLDSDGVAVGLAAFLALATRAEGKKLK